MHQRVPEVLWLCCQCMLSCTQHTYCPDTKFIAAQRGYRMSLLPKHIALVVPGDGYTQEDLQRFVAAAAECDMSLLEIAWAIAVEDSSTPAVSLSALCELLFDTDAPLQQYTTYCMLNKDRVYFKQVCVVCIFDEWIWGCSFHQTTSTKRPTACYGLFSHAIMHPTCSYRHAVSNCS